jgi:hypothetical protein
MKPDDSLYKGTDPFTREQAISVVECILIGALDRVESALPHTISYEDRLRDDPRDDAKLTAYERGGLEAAGMSLGTFFAQLTGEGLDVYDALACATVNDVSFDVAIEQLVRGAWADRGVRIRAAARRPRTMEQLYDSLWPDTRKHAEAFVADVFSGYDFAPDAQGAEQRAGKRITRLFPVDVTDHTVIRYWIEADSAEAAKETAEEAESKAELEEIAVDHEALTGARVVELPVGIGPWQAQETCSAKTVRALVDAAETVLVNMLDSGAHGPDDDRDKHGNYPVDEHGDVWYPDVWHLNEAMNPFRDDVKRKEAEDS